MAGIATVILSLLAVFLLVRMYRQHNRGEVHLLSMRNIVIGGFVVFQLYSAIVWLINPATSPHVRLHDRFSSIFQFTVMALVFSALLLWVYRYGRLADRLVPRPRERRSGMTSKQLAVVSLVLTAGAVALNLLPPLGHITLVLDKVAQAMPAAAVGVMAWAWARQPRNVPLLLLLLATFGLHAVMLLDNFSRRPMLGLGLAGVWAVYYVHLRYLPARRIALASAALAVPILCAMIVLTSIRYDRPESVQEAVEMTRHLDLQLGISRTLTPQNAGPVSMWVIDRYPEQFETRHLFTMRWLVLQYVPRAWWPTKPEGLGFLLSFQMGYMDWDELNLGPGIIGHAAAEGGWYALILYTVLIGLFLRWADLLVAAPNRSPITVVLVGCSLGEMFALTRGEVAFFFNIYVMGVVGTALVAYPTAKLVQALLPARAPALPTEFDEETWTEMPAPKPSTASAWRGTTRRDSSVSGE